MILHFLGRTMKKLVGMVLFLGVAVLITYMGAKALKKAEESFLIGIAFGEPTKDVISVHVPIQVTMVRTEGPKLRNGVVQWFEWIDEHFDLRDDRGERVNLKKLEFSSLITSRDVAAPEFFIGAKIKPGEKYTFAYIPFVGGSQRYRHEFTAPSDATGFQRINLPPLTAP